jgi:DNA polymerase-3 subunit gamma/tau
MEDSQLVKKKLVDAQYPIRIKKIVPLSNIVVNKEAKLIIETNSAGTTKSSTATDFAASNTTKVNPAANTAPASASSASASSSNTLPAIESNQTKVNSTPSAIESIQTATSGEKKNLLAALQHKYGKEYNIQEVKESKPLDMDTLQNCWNDYIAYLETTNKHSSTGTFKLALLQIEDEVHFTITVPALTAQKFVEQERMNLLEKIWDTFENRAIQFSILVDAGEKEDVPLHLRLNSKQKYERIAEQYPLVKDLKNRLNLEIYF